MKNTKWLIITAISFLIIGLLIGWVITKPKDLLGASSRPIHYVYDMVNGMYVGGNQIFDSSAKVTLPKTASVAGIATMATTSVTSFCVKNAEGIWTKITFTGVTPSYATSTNCI